MLSTINHISYHRGTMATAARRPASQSPADEAWALLHQLMMSERRRFIGLAAALDLHPAQTALLARMEPEVPVPMSELAITLHCDNSNVTGIVDRLEARGLVERRPHEHDRRVKHVVLTPQGEAVQQRVRAGMSEAPSAFKRLPAADQRVLRDILRRALAEG
jgi:MarR family transcriptional regulator, organic hydroperoxide resistance regulator